jgi:hypothetical protein
MFECKRLAEYAAHRQSDEMHTGDAETVQHDGDGACQIANRVVAYCIAAAVAALSGRSTRNPAASSSGTCSAHILPSVTSECVMQTMAPFSGPTRS